MNSGRTLLFMAVPAFVLAFAAAAAGAELQFVLILTVIPVALAVFVYPFMALPIILGSLVLHGLYVTLLTNPAPAKFLEPAATVLLVIVVMASKSTLFLRPDRLILTGKLPIAIISFIAYIGLVAAISEDQLAGWLGFASLCTYTLLFFVAAWSLRRFSEVAAVGWCLLALAVVVALLGLGEFFFDWNFRLSRGEWVGEYRRIGSTLGSPLPLGMFMAFAWSVGLSAVLQTKRGAKRWLLVGVMVLCGVALLLTHSRSGWLAAILSTAIVFRQASAGRRVLLGTGVVCVAVATLWIATQLASGESLASRLTSATDFSTDTGNVSRLDRWKIGWERATQSELIFLFGAGLGTTGQVAATILSMRHPTLDDPYYLSQYYVETESWVLHLLNEGGLAGTLLFFGIPFTLWRSRRRRGAVFPPQASLWLIGFNAALWGLLISNILLPTLTSWSISALFWATLGINYAGEVIASPAPGGSPRPRRRYAGVSDAGFRSPVPKLPGPPLVPTQRRGPP